MLYSSGTTGRPKAVTPPLPADGNGSWAQSVIRAGTRRALRDDPGRCVPSPAPLYHAAGINYTMAVHRVGAAAVLMRRFDPEDVLRLIAEHRDPCAVRADDVRPDAETARTRSHCV